MNADWFRLRNADEIESPALLISPAALDANLRQMISIAGSADRLWPHVKTHKLAPVVARQIGLGITKFKAATLAEAQMAAETGASRVLLAYPLVGRNVQSYLGIAGAFPKTRFACLADAPGPVAALSEAAVAVGQTLEVFLDLDCGMHRTGILPGPEAVALYRQIASSRGLVAAGLHAYDGHIDGQTRLERAETVAAAFAPVAALRAALIAAGLSVPTVIAGGTPSFPIHAGQPEVECSPGTTTLWSWCLAESCPDLSDFQLAAVLLARVVSRPLADRLTLDLGHKAVASENPLARRIRFPDLPEAEVIGHSEEHLVIRTPRASEFPPGTVLYGHPWHICPTVALHGSAIIVENQRAIGRWPITARDRWISPLMDSSS